MWADLSFQEQNIQIARAQKQTYVLWGVEGPGYTRRRGYASEYLSARIRFAYIHPKDNDLKLYSSFDRGELADLIVTAQSGKSAWKDRPENCTYGWSVGYESFSTVVLQDAEIMVKVLRKIARGLDRLAENEGQPKTFGGYVNRVARVLRVKGHAQKNYNLPVKGNLGAVVNDLDNKIYRVAQKAWGEK